MSVPPEMVGLRLRKKKKSSRQFEDNLDANDYCFRGRQENDAAVVRELKP